MRLYSTACAMVITVICQVTNAETGFTTTCNSGSKPSNTQIGWGMKACLTSLAKLSTCADNLKEGTYASTQIGNSVAVFSQSASSELLTSMEAIHWCQVLVGYCVDGAVQCNSCSTSMYIYQLASKEAAATDASINSTGPIADAPIRPAVVGRNTVTTLTVAESSTSAPLARKEVQNRSLILRASPSCAAPGNTLISNSYCALKLVAEASVSSRVWPSRNSGLISTVLGNLLAQYQTISSSAGPLVTPVLSATEFATEPSISGYAWLTVAISTDRGTPWNVVLQSLQEAHSPGSGTDYNAAKNAVIGMWTTMQQNVQDYTTSTGIGYSIVDFTGSTLYSVFISRGTLTP